MVHMDLFVCSYVGHKYTFCYDFCYSLLYKTHCQYDTFHSLTKATKWREFAIWLLVTQAIRHIKTVKHVTSPSEEERCH